MLLHGSWRWPFKVVNSRKFNKSSTLFQEPFEQMSDIFKEKLSSSDVAQLNRILRKIDMDLFLPRLLEMVLLNVKHAKENIVSMRWDWILLGHLHFKYNLWAQVQAQDTAKGLNIQRDNSLASTSLVDFGPICTLYSVVFQGPVVRRPISAFFLVFKSIFSHNFLSYF